MRSVAFALLAAAAAATPALAQDAAPFTGPRLEGIVGWDRVQGDSEHRDAVMYGLAAGYDVQFNNGVIGGEIEASDSDVRLCEGTVAAGDQLCVRAGRDLYVGGRIGTLVGDRGLLYGKVGYTNARFNLRGVDTANGPEINYGSADFDGLRAGVGGEYAVGPNSYVKAEYRYSNYEDGLARHQAVAGFGFRF